MYGLAQSLPPPNMTPMTPHCPSSLSSLYDQLQNPSDFYNVSANSTEINPNTGIPYGFFHYPLANYPDGYPVLFDINLSTKRALELLVYLQVG